MKTESLLALFSLQDRVALITGAGGGIGRKLAEGLGKAGAKVALNGRSVEKLEQVKNAIEADGGEADVFPADISKLDEIPGMVTRVIERYGRIDILVNCAGINRRMPILEMTPETYDQIMATNARGLYFLTREVVPHMIAQGGGKIINIGSITSTIGLQDVSVYGMTKSGLAELTKTMAVEWAEYNIQVNCLCPGFIETELTAPLWQHPTRSRWILDRTPLKRPGKPEDLVGMLIFMASPASDFMTGQSVYLDGGMLAGSQWNPPKE